MHDGAVRSGTRDRGKRHILQETGVAAEAFQGFDRGDFGECAVRRLAVEPGEKARHRHAVAQMRLVRAFDLDRVLHRLHQRDRIGAAGHLAAGGRHDTSERVGRGRLVEPHGLAGEAECRELADEIGRLADVGDLFEIVPHRVGKLRAVDVERGLALRRHDGECNRQRRVRDVAAADVEGPGHRMRIGDHQSVGAQVCDFGADTVELGTGVFAGIAEIVQRHGACGQCRPVGPDRIDRVGLGRHESCARVGAGARQLLRAVHRVQPRVVAELGLRLEILPQPLVGRCLADIDDGEHRSVHLHARLNRVAAVDEQRRPVFQDHRRSRRSGEAGQPGEPLLAARHILVLVAVGAGQDQARQSPPGEFGTQSLDPRPGLGRLGVVKRLKTRLEHHWGNLIWAI